MDALTLLFGLRARVSRRSYLAWGFGLAAVKFAVDTLLVYSFTHKIWSPLGYLVPSIVLRESSVGHAPEAMYLLMALLALPFLWIGLSMSVRRAADANLSAWIGMLFLVPLVNYAVIALLGYLPTSPQASWNPPEAGRLPAASIPPGPRAALLGMLASVAIGLSMIFLSVYGLRLYGAGLFFATPFAMGAVSATIYNRPVLRALLPTLGVAGAGVLLTGSAVLLFAIEGVLCLGMAAPIALLLAGFGAVLARAVIQASPRSLGASPALFLMLPGLIFGESRLAAPTLREVTTSIDIDAPPERVWPHVIGFSDLDEPPEWFFRLGVAYPQRARITGEGVGAVRRCQFSTGDFIEPITEWSPPHRLAFDVTGQPPSMTEWSPYHDLHAPHLEGYLKSRGGEFDLTALPGGRTRLTGTTHYTLAIYPELYWVPYAELLLHAIHHRVLAHIQHLSES